MNADQALVEIDVLTAMALGMTLEQLKTIYRIQFPVLQQYEADTWYDANGRIVFTTNRSLVGVGFDRKEWEGNVKGAPAGKVFHKRNRGRYHARRPHKENDRVCCSVR